MLDFFVSQKFNSDRIYFTINICSLWKKNEQYFTKLVVKLHVAIIKFFKMLLNLH